METLVQHWLDLFILGTHMFSSDIKITGNSPRKNIGNHGLHTTEPIGFPATVPGKSMPAIP